MLWNLQIHQNCSYTLTSILSVIFILKIVIVRLILLSNFIVENLKSLPVFCILWFWIKKQILNCMKHHTIIDTNNRWQSYIVINNKYRGQEINSLPTGRKVKLAIFFSMFLIILSRPLAKNVPELVRTLHTGCKQIISHMMGKKRRSKGMKEQTHLA